MAITIELPEVVERILTRRAERAGRTLELYATSLLVRESEADSFDEILAPFRQEVAESGMTEEEFGALIEQARKEAWAEKHGTAP